MDIAAYRKQCLAEVAGAKDSVADYVPAAPPSGAATEMLAAAAPVESDDLRLDPARFDASVRKAILMAADASARKNERLGALDFLGAAAFLSQAFAPFHAEYVTLLRKLAIDRYKDARRLALGRLAQMGDAYGQRLLRESLQGSRKALVPQAQAIQWLGLDDHGDAKPMLRDIAGKSTGKVREAALRTLAADPKSAALLETISADKSESNDVRQAAVLSLKRAAPARFAKAARRIVLDDDDDDGLRATAMSAIAHTDEVRAELSGPGFAKAVAGVAERTGSRSLKASIKRFAAAMPDD